jgi:hypothetical protein
MAAVQLEMLNLIPGLTSGCHELTAIVEWNQAIVGSRSEQERGPIWEPVER